MRLGGKGRHHTFVDYLLPSRRATFIYATIALIVVLYYINFEIIFSHSTGDLYCAAAIKKHVQESGYFESPVKDLLLMFAEYGLTKEARKKFTNRPVTTYFHTSKELKERIHEQASCQKQNKLTRNVAVCSYQSTTAEYVQEWASHYILLGVSKIYLYDNNAESYERNRLHKALHPFIDAKFVEYIPYSGKKQDMAVQDCFHKRAKHADWVTFLDLDEFLLINDKNFECLPEFLENFEEKQKSRPPAAIALLERNVVTQGVAAHNSSQTLLEQAVYWQDFNENFKKHIAFMKGARDYEYVHVVYAKPGYYFYDPSGQEITGDFLWNLTAGPAWFESHLIGIPESLYDHLELRHFWGLSLEYLIYDKVCGESDERERLMEPRASIALYPFRKNTNLKKLDPSRHQPILHEFLLGRRNFIKNK